jgi:hypothetical protein
VGEIGRSTTNEANALIEEQIDDLGQTVAECEIGGNTEMEKAMEMDENANAVFLFLIFCFTLSRNSSRNAAYAE